MRDIDKKMENKSAKWLIYTVLVGLIPILSRFFVWIATKSGAVELFNAADFVAFGLVLHISNINEIEHLSLDNKSWKTIQNGISIAFISFYSVLFALTLLSTQDNTYIEKNATKYCVMVLSAISFLLSFSVFHRVSKAP